LVNKLLIAFWAANICFFLKVLFLNLDLTEAGRTFDFHSPSPLKGYSVGYLEKSPSQGSAGCALRDEFHTSRNQSRAEPTGQTVEICQDLLQPAQAA
jgi:hypothetical protein